MEMSNEVIQGITSERSLQSVGEKKRELSWRKGKSTIQPQGSAVRNVGVGGENGVEDKNGRKWG
jgi:hypothetical protein